MAAGDAGKLGIFISYSRDNLDFTDQLDATLGLHGFTTAIDRHGVSGGENWQGRLGNLPLVYETWHALHNVRLRQRERVVFGRHREPVNSAVFSPGSILTRLGRQDGAAVEPRWKR